MAYQKMKWIQFKFVTYEMFGAKSDSINDDGKAIKLAHDFANAANVPVINLCGEYWIKNTWNIEIKTNVMWGHSRFYIKESEKGKNVIFQILSRKESYSLSQSELAALSNKIQKGTAFIPELAAYEGCFVHVKDDHTTWVVRSSTNSSFKLSDSFVVEKGGFIVGEITKDILTPTSVTIYPMDDNYLTIDGGNFIITGDSDLKCYLGGVICSTRSRVMFRNLFSYIENDTSSAPNHGIYDIKNCFDVTIDNFKFTPRVKPGDGSYAMIFTNVVRMKLINLVGEAHSDTTKYWGAMGSNFIKDLYVYNSHINRIDCHAGAYNITIKDSCIGEEGVKVSGGGKLVIENCTAYQNLIELRSDYGSRWDGDIIIKNILMIVTSPNVSPTLIDIYMYAHPTHDFVYETMLADALYVEGVTYNYTMQPQNTADTWLLYLRANRIDRTLPERRQYRLPKKITFKDVKTIGRASNTGLLLINDSNVYRGYGEFLYRPVDENTEPQNNVLITELIPNCEILFENIELKRMDPSGVCGESHINFKGIHGNTSKYVSTKCFVPKIIVKNCNGVRIAINGAAAEVLVQNSIIEMFTSFYGGNRAKVKLELCRLKPRVTFPLEKAFQLTNANSELISCKIEPVEINGIPDVDNLSAYGFMTSTGISCRSIGSYLDLRFSTSRISYKPYTWLLLGGTSSEQVINSNASNIAEIVTDFNNLLLKLRNQGIIQ